jgi:hypothetical protein
MTDSPDTVTEAMAFLAREGYTDEIRLVAGGLECDSVEGVYDASTAVVDHTFRFEGPSDPGDEAIVLGISLPDWGVKGVLMSAFGHDADPNQAEVLRALVR